MKTPPISVAYDPTQTGWVTLPRHEQIAEDLRPAFQVRFLTVRRNRAARDLYLEGSRETVYERANALIDQALAMLLVGWRNVVDAEGKAIPFPSPDAVAAFHDAMAKAAAPEAKPAADQAPTPAPPAPALFDDLGTWDEKRDVFVDLLHGMRFAELDRKKKSSSASRSGSERASSADPAPPPAGSLPPS
jgi:hypothetical protein